MQRPVSDAAEERYRRHLLLPGVGPEGQARLARSRVLVVGAGGLGCPVLQYLAAAGVGTIELIDHDVVDLSNLQRQVLYTTADLGSPKVAVAAARLLAMNPSITVVPHAERLHVDNALALFERCDVVVDGTDDLPTRYLIADAAELTGTPVVYGAILRFDGQVSVFNHQGGPGYRDLYPTPPDADSVPNCAEAGVLGVLPGVIGTIQATEALKLLLGLGTTLSGRVLLYDARSLRFHEIALERDPARESPTHLGATELPVQGTRHLERLAWEQVDARRAQGWKPRIVDVRTHQELALRTYPHTTDHVPHRELPAGLPGDEDLLLFCKAGARSQAAARTLERAGYTRIYDVIGGLDAWEGR